MPNQANKQTVTLHLQITLVNETLIAHISFGIWKTCAYSILYILVIPMKQQVVSSALPMLILGLGWTGQFLAELLASSQIGYAATTRDGRNNTIQWSLPSVCDSIDTSMLPLAKTVLVTFPVMRPECMSSLINAYETKYGSGVQWILLSSTRPYVGCPANRRTPLEKSKDTGRMGAEDVVVKHGGSILHFSGLWGNQRYYP